MSDSKTIRAGVIGAGLRASSYFRNIPESLRSRIQLVALADPNAAHRQTFAEKFAAASTPRFYENGADLLAREELDALVIGSPNHAHAADALQAIERGIPLMLEKPVATSVEDCRRLWQAFSTVSAPPITVGFVLRYTPFYTKAHELVQQGAIGEPFAMDADENIGPGLTRLFFRGWRRWSRDTGGFIVEKCCHDLDILRWLTGAEATRVYSTARRTHFVNRPQAERWPHFDGASGQGAALDFSDRETQQLFDTTQNASLYEIESDLPDHQSVMIEWSNGVVSNFTACFAQPRTTRNIRIRGSHGFLQGDIGLSALILERAGDVEAAPKNAEEIVIEHDATGHHGGDSHIASQFWNSCETRQGNAKAGLREGIEAVLIGLAAEESARTGSPVEVTPLRERVFQPS